jgi:Ice-binding-like
LILAGGAMAKNIFWQVAGAVTIGTYAHFEGILLGKTVIGVNTGATVNGRLLAQTAVTLQMNPVTQPAQ